MSSVTASHIRKADRFFETLTNSIAALPPFELQLPGIPSRTYGSGEPVFSIIARSFDGMRALLSKEEIVIAQAYVNGDLDLDGDLLAMYTLRNALKDNHPLQRLWWVKLQPWLFGQINRDKEWIAQHYDLDQDFYLLFLDRKHRCYSQGIFTSATQDLESAMTHKLEYALENCQTKPGQRILDIGGGWGSFCEYAGRKGLRVTSLTISQESLKFMQNIISRQTLPCEVLFEHFYEHKSKDPYDAIVNLGVTEHLPDYQRTLTHCYNLLKPGGRLYVDASAAREKFSFSSFIYRFIYPGNPTPMCMSEYVSQIERSPFELLALNNDRLNYERTARKWAENLDRSAQFIIDRWGNNLYRRFRLYLWGTVHAFATNLMSAYRIVLQKPLNEVDLSRWRKPEAARKVA